MKFIIFLLLHAASVVPVKREVVFLYFKIVTIFSLVTSLSACLATRQTHSEIFNMQGQPSLFHERNSG